MISSMLLHDVIMSAIRRVSGNDFVLKQDSAPAHRSRAPNLWPPNSPDLSAGITRSGLSCSIIRYDTIVGI